MAKSTSPASTSRIGKSCAVHCTVTCGSFRTSTLSAERFPEIPLPEESYGGKKRSADGDFSVFPFKRTFDGVLWVVSGEMITLQKSCHVNLN